MEFLNYADHLHGLLQHLLYQRRTIVYNGFQLLENSINISRRNIFLCCGFKILYCLELDNKRKELCTIDTLYGLFPYKRLAMGVKVLLVAAKVVITKILTGLNCIAYINDCGIWTDTMFKQHMELVGKVRKRLNILWFTG